MLLSIDEKTMVVKPKSLKTTYKREMRHKNKGIVFAKSKSLKINGKIMLEGEQSHLKQHGEGCQLI